MPVLPLTEPSCSPPTRLPAALRAARALFLPAGPRDPRCGAAGGGAGPASGAGRGCEHTRGAAGLGCRWLDSLCCGCLRAGCFDGLAARFACWGCRFGKQILHRTGCSSSCSLCPAPISIPTPPPMGAQTGPAGQLPQSTAFHQPGTPPLPPTGAQAGDAEQCSPPAGAVCAGQPAAADARGTAGGQQRRLGLALRVPHLAPGWVGVATLGRWLGRAGRGQGRR